MFKNIIFDYSILIYFILFFVPIFCVFFINFLFILIYFLGFDTASEVALLGLTAMNASSIPSSYILVLPCLFASGMSLIDTLDGILMLYAYSWASVDRKRRIFFNLYLTSVSGK